MTGKDEMLKNTDLADLELDFTHSPEKPVAPPNQQPTTHASEKTESRLEGRASQAESRRTTKTPAKGPARQKKSKPSEDQTVTASTDSPEPLVKGTSTRDLSFAERQHTVHFEHEIHEAVCDLEYQLRKERGRMAKAERPSLPNRSAIIMAGLRIALKDEDKIRELLGFSRS